MKNDDFGNRMKGFEAAAETYLDVHKPQSHFSPKELHGKRQRDMIQMLGDIGIDYDTIDAHLRWGSFVKRRLVPEGDVMRSEYFRESPNFGAYQHLERVTYLFE